MATKKKATKKSLPETVFLRDGAYSEFDDFYAVEEPGSVVLPGTEAVFGVYELTGYVKVKKTENVEMVEV